MNALPAGKLLAGLIQNATVNAVTELPVVTIELVVLTKLVSVVAIAFGNPNPPEAVSVGLKLIAVATLNVSTMLLNSLTSDAPSSSNALTVKVEVVPTAT